MVVCYTDLMVNNAGNSAPIDQFPLVPQPGVIILKDLIEEEHKQGGFSIHIADTMSNKDSCGIVVAVGGAQREVEKDGNTTIIEPPVKIGDKVVYANFSPNRYLSMKYGRLHLIKFNEVLAINNE